MDRKLVKRWIQLMAGLFGCGLAVALMIRSRLGLGPWDAFHVGLHRITGLTVGTVSILVGVAILFGTWFLGVRPGLGTLVNMVMIGVFMDLLLLVTPEAGGILTAFVYYGAGIIVFGLATGMYLGAGLGSGPRDGLMIAVSEIRGLSVRRVRTFIELAVLVAGWLMGAQVGIGTIVFALTIGPATQWGMQLAGVTVHPRAASSAAIAEAARNSTGDRRVA
ncbi:MAG TPA: hypothetical protein VF167_17545 [Longimicrobiaceae bacterium]